MQSNLSDCVYQNICQPASAPKQTGNASNVTDFHLLHHCNQRNLDLVLQLCPSQQYCDSAVDPAGRRTRAVVLRLAAVRGFSLAVEPFQRSDVQLPSRCCGGQRESFSDGRRYANTQPKLYSQPKRTQIQAQIT